MKLHRKVLPVVAAVFFAVALPLSAFTLIEMVPTQQRVRVAQGAAFRTQVRLAQVALCDGSVRLQPGAFNVEIFSMGDGSVRGSFFDLSGRKVGEAHGVVIGILKQGNTVHSTALPATQLPAIQHGAAAKTAAPATPAMVAPITFATLGFQPNSKSSFSQMGQKLNLEVVSADGSHQVLIGLLLPAVMPAGH
jgi:hypothetical protein